MHCVKPVAESALLISLQVPSASCCAPQGLSVVLGSTANSSRLHARRPLPTAARAACQQQLAGHSYVTLQGRSRWSAQVVAAAPAQAPVLPTWLSPAAEKYRFITNKRISVSIQCHVSSVNKHKPTMCLHQSLCTSYMRRDYQKFLSSLCKQTPATVVWVVSNISSA